MTGALWHDRSLPDAVAEDLRFFGADPDALPVPPDDPTEGLWPEHLPAMDAFCAVASQWRIVPGAGMGGRARALGLDYAACEAGLRLAGLGMTPELWAELRLIEAGARAALNGA